VRLLRTIGASAVAGLLAVSGLRAAAVAVASGPGKTGCREPRLQVSASPSTPRQGAIVAVTLRSDVPLERATLSDASGAHVAPMEPDAEASGRVFRALWGIDFEASPGVRRFRVEAIGLCEDARATIWQARIVSGRFPVQSLTVDPAFVEPPPEERERIEREKKEVARVWSKPPTARRWDAGFRLPVAAPLRANFGARRIFNGQPRSRHNGVDLAAASGAPVTAPAPGTVALAEDLYFSGGTVIVDHGDGLFTTYFHLSRIDVAAGDAVRAGDSLGAVGATGRATGPHLHWGARLNGARVNPADLQGLPRWRLREDEGSR